MRKITSNFLAVTALTVCVGCEGHMNSAAYFDSPNPSSGFASSVPYAQENTRALRMAANQQQPTSDAFSMRLNSETIKHWRAGPTSVVSVWRGGVINQPGALFVATMTSPLNNHATQAAHLEVPSSVANTYAGQVLTITVKAKKAPNGSTDSFALNYTTADGDSTGWVKFNPAGRYHEYSVSFEKPPSVSVSPDYISIWADTEATGRSLIVSEVTVSAEPRDSEEPRLVVANMTPTLSSTLGGQISASNQRNGLTVDLAGNTDALAESGSIVAIDDSRIPPLQGVSDYGVRLMGTNALDRKDIAMPNTPLGNTRSTSENLRPRLKQSSSDLWPMLMEPLPDTTSKHATEKAQKQLGYLDTQGNFVAMSQAEQDLLALGSHSQSPNVKPKTANADAAIKPNQDETLLKMQRDTLASEDLRPNAGDFSMKALDQGSFSNSETPENILELGLNKTVAPNSNSGAGLATGDTPLNPAPINGIETPNTQNTQIPGLKKSAKSATNGLTDADIELMIDPLNNGTFESSDFGSVNSSGYAQNLQAPEHLKQASLAELLSYLPAADLSRMLEALKKEDDIKTPIVEILPAHWTWGAHLASYPDPGLAEIGWSILVRQYRGLTYFTPRIQRVILGDGTWIMYRLFAGPLETKATAEAFCASVAQNWEYCVPRHLASYTQAPH